MRRPPTFTVEAPVRPLILLTALSTGCVASAPRPADLHVQYDCGGYRFAAHYGNQFASVTLPDGTALNLRQVVTASGTRYSDGTNTLAEQGGVARLELADTVHPQCSPL